MSHDAELELTAALNFCPGNIVISNAQGIIIKASVSNAAIYGVSQQEFVGSSLFELESKGILNPSVSLEVLRTGKEAQVMQVTQHGRVMMSEGFPIFDQDNNLYRVISFATDLTEIRQLKKEYEWLQTQFMAQSDQALSPPKQQTNLPSKSQVIGKIHQLLQRVSRSDASILFLGESGVGKTAFSKLVHEQSERSSGPFIEVNCSTIPETLFESEMFGYAPGAFTGANKQGKVGLIEQAQGGTLFLDEIGELPLPMQAKLLKVLQDGKVSRIGSTSSQLINFRLITATNQELNQRVENGEFRLDLYYRINVIPISIPPLKDRIEDIPVLLDFILTKLNARYGEEKVISSRLRRHFLNHTWPGNVRELENALERSYLASIGKMIQPFDDFSNQEQALLSPPQPVPQMSMVDPVIPGQRSLNDAMDEVEKHLLQQALEHCKGTYELARYLGISQPTASRRLKKHGLK